MMRDFDMDMIDRVAEAMRLSAIERGQPIPAIARHLAAAAIEAMREPTEAMKRAGFEFTGDPCWPEDVGRAWQTMIDAALNPSQT